MQHENTSHGVSIHQYGPNVGTGNATIDTAAFAWLRAEHSGRAWILDGVAADGSQRIYNVNGRVGTWGLERQELIGNNARINQLDPNEHVWAMGDVSNGGNIVQDVVLSTPDEQAHTKAALGVLGNCSQSQIKNVFGFRVHDVMAMDVGDGGAGSYVGFFSNTVNNLKGNTFKGMPLRMLTQNGGSTGNHFQNLYFTNGNGATVERPFHFSIFWGNSFSQINFERMTFSDPGLFQQCFGQVIDSMYFEECTFANGGAMQVFSPGSTVHFDGLNFLNNQMAFNTSPLFTMGEDTEITIDGGIWDGAGGPSGVLINPAGTVADSKFTLRNFRWNTTEVNPLGSTIADRVFLQHNEDWFTMFDGADRYRITAPGGAYTSTLV